MGLKEEIVNLLLKHDKTEAPPPPAADGSVPAPCVDKLVEQVARLGAHRQQRGLQALSG